VRAHSTIDAHGQRITSGKLKQLVEAAPRRCGRPLLCNANFEGATFVGAADFGGAIFTGDASFDGAIFEGPVHFDKATFVNVASFDKRATFMGDVYFPEVTFCRDASFREAKFEGDAHFDKATFNGSASFHKASLKEAFALGPMLVLEQLELDGASFDGIEIRVSANRLSCDRTVFHGPANLQIRWAEIALDRAVFERASVLAASDDFTALPSLDKDEQRALKALHEREQIKLAPRCEGRAEVHPERHPTGRKQERRTPRPRLVSLRRANVGNLVVSDVDLRACRFAGAHNLDQLRFEGNIEWPNSLEGWSWKTRPLGLRRPRVRRRTIAEEHGWRKDRLSQGEDPADEEIRPKGFAARWYPKKYQSPPWLESLADTKVLHPSEIAREVVP
jgi:uncharacterized protein YjbI with pentapeptide repeats